MGRSFFLSVPLLAAVRGAGAAAGSGDGKLGKGAVPVMYLDRDQLGSVMKSLDANHDGKLTLGDFDTHGYCWGFLTADRSGDGKLDKEEFPTMYKLVTKEAAEAAENPNEHFDEGQMGRLMNSMDANHDGVLKLEDFKDRENFEAGFVAADTNGDGRLDKGEFQVKYKREMQQTAQVASIAIEHAAQEQLKTMMESMDTNRDGHLTLDDFDQHGYCRAFFASDTSRDGKLSREEFPAMHKHVVETAAEAAKNPSERLDQEQVGSVMASMDVNHDGTLTLDDFAKLGDFEAVFLAADTNGDGKIDRAEFPRYYQHLVEAAAAAQTGASQKAAPQAEAALPEEFI